MWAVGYGDQWGVTDRVPVILASADGGASWQPQTAPAGTPAELTGVAFSDASHGWVVGAGGIVLQTSNGGTSWTKQTVQPVTNLLGTVCAGGHAWTIGANGAVFTSTDNGANWKAQVLPAGTALTGVAFRDAAHGWAVGGFDTVENGAWGEVDRSASVVVNTGDGGATWSLQASPSGARNLEAVSFVDTTRGWAVGHTYDVDEYGDETNNRAAVVATDNGGATWTAQTVPSGAEKLTDVDFVDALHGWTVGYSYGSDTYTSVILVTSDGGTTWTRQTVPSEAGPLSSVDFADSTHGWVVGGSDSVLMTSNGGATWTIKQVTASGIPQSFHGVAFADAQHGLVVGLTATQWEDHTVAARTVDGGVTWKRQKLDSYDPLLAADLLDASRGWAVGEKGLACVTTDGGATWTEQTVPTGQGLSATSTSSTRPTAGRWATRGRRPKDASSSPLAAPLHRRATPPPPSPRPTRPARRRARRSSWPTKSSIRHPAAAKPRSPSRSTSAKP